MSVILPHIECMKAYPLGARPPEGSAVIKLNQNENPYPPSPLVLEELRAVKEEELRRYPDSRYPDLRQALAGLHGMEEEQVFCGNGSSEIISLVMKVFVGHQGTIALPDPSFSLYATAAETYQVKCVSVPLSADFTVNADKLCESGADAIILINPHAPTGLSMPLFEVERLAAEFPGLLVIDEAYIDFADRPDACTAIPLVGRYENVLVVRTFSKAYALCGARIGYCIAPGRLIAALEKGRDIYNVNAVSLRLAMAALEDRAHMERSAAAIRWTRDCFVSELRRLGFEVLPSQTNFVLCTVPTAETGVTAERLCTLLMERNIYVRYFDHPRLADKLRISIGTDEEMETVLSALHGLLS